VKINGEFFNAVLENLNEGVFFADRNRRIEYWNKRAEKITGYKNSDIIGKCCNES
jgi:PAS domain S-box-containing protein